MDLLKDRLGAIGFPADYTVTLPVHMNGTDLLDHIQLQNTEEDRKDFLWLCDQIQLIDQTDPHTVEYRDNFRACRSDAHKSTDIAYDTLQAHGCCGSYDALFVNPETGNHFMIGFNYGH